MGISFRAKIKRPCGMHRRRSAFVGLSIREGAGGRISGSPSCHQPSSGQRFLLVKMVIAGREQVRDRAICDLDKQDQPEAVIG